MAQIVTARNCRVHPVLERLEHCMTPTLPAIPGFVIEFPRSGNYGATMATHYRIWGELVSPDTEVG